MTPEEREEIIARDAHNCKIQRQIDDLKRELSATDYQVIKCYEASLMNEEMPYDYETVIADRQKKRDKINELQSQLEDTE